MAVPRAFMQQTLVWTMMRRVIAPTMQRILGLQHETSFEHPEELLERLLRTWHRRRIFQLAVSLTLAALTGVCYSPVASIYVVQHNNVSKLS